MGKRKTLGQNIPHYYTINWDANRNEMEFYDVMPYFVNCWNEEKARKHKIWAIHFNDKNKDSVDDTKMPETFEEFKCFILSESFHNFWSRCEYEVIVSDWPPHPRRDENDNIKMYNYTVYRPEKRDISTIDFYDQKLDVHQQIKANIDVVTKVFMDYING